MRVCVCGLGLVVKTYMQTTYRLVYPSGRIITTISFRESHSIAGIRGATMK